ncbi:MAG: lytic transglycosylase domain-containing protein [Gammaproteobacteria bacterium TMED1]|jgi:hypothetical protein|nr:MAG: lytic transglycosylase domain-containing protein [Gammaproteobacteria bacterium TMED1]
MNSNFFKSFKNNQTKAFVITHLLLFTNISNASDDDFPYRKCFENSADKYGLAPSFVAAVASVESSFNPRAQSSSDALGLMQIKWPQTAKELNIEERSELFDPCKNIDAGADYLSRLKRRFGSKLMALAAYYQGPTKIGREKSIPLLSVGYIERVLREEQLISASRELKGNKQCEISEFQQIAMFTHHPKERFNKTYTWLKKYQKLCSTPVLLRIRNRLPELMGTADTKGALRIMIDTTIQEKSAAKKVKPGLPPAFPNS